MRRQPTVNLGNLLLSLSDAMDLASPKLAQHQQRTAFVAWQMGKIAGLADLATEELFIAALLHDIGALSVEEKVALRQATIEGSEVEDVEGHCIRGETLL
ncbi:MAG: HDOD domain-containing protein, partial [Deltaproteobacteria bacterium]|nr:HDOD domain-containing protein [Deltaproteobacteria bacterium]